ncbi:MAG: hypothetical protein ACAI25_18605, partial [Planctomycetota bacterium]
MANEAAADEPKKKRLRGELLSCLRLIPYMRPFKWGIALLVFVTFVHASANAARAWLIMPLFNSILLRGSAVVDNIDDQAIADVVTQTTLDNATATAMTTFDKSKTKEVFALEDFGLGRAPAVRGDPRYLEDPLAQLLLRTRGSITAACDRLVASTTAHKPEPKGSWPTRAKKAIKNAITGTFETPPSVEKVDELQWELHKAVH